ncbi:MAG: phenylalanine--tRNA ligase subunit beta [Candidatus Margulisiibacteriota bacterium]|jgi:phenylalanyl-tRNA synthetase beta chain
MRFSLNWLKELVEINCDCDQLIEKLILSGFEVESVEKINEKLSQIIVGKIIKIEKHPNADKLQITTIFDGEKEHLIVTGAANVFEGAIVPVSLPGSVLANGMEIKPAKLRGVDSFGMLCSKVELGLAEESHGIWLLPENTPLGVDLTAHYQLKDVILDIAILPNRGDCQSVFGMAREISVILNTDLKKPDFKLEFTVPTTKINIKVTAPDLCPKYTARVIKNVVIKESPFWLQQKLMSAGIRPINNVVDITNYVLLVFGQPLHAFDLDKLSGNTVNIRKAFNGEIIQTLDGKEFFLSTEDLVIAETENPIALAGVMGGLNSEIEPTTKNVFLEAAFFDPSAVRKTAKKLGIRTESSIRFEKGIDFDQVEFASDYASFLLTTLAQGQVEETFFTAINSNYLLAIEKRIEFDAEKINKLLNSSFSKEEMVNVLTKLGFSFNSNQDQISIPSWRKFDIQEIPCLAEEIARILGYDRIPATLPSKSSLIHAENKVSQYSSQIQNILIDHGFFEVKTFPMISEEDQKYLKEETDLVLKNPISQNESVMRTNLLPSLLKILDFNYKRQIENIRIFEIGKIFKPLLEKNSDPKSVACLEQAHLTALALGKIAPKAYLEKSKINNEIDFSYLKSMAELILKKLNIDFSYSCEKLSHYLHPKKSLNLYHKNTLIGEIGMLHPAFSAQYDFSLEIGYFNLNLTLLNQLTLIQKKYQAFSKFPKMKRDLALLASKNLNYKTIEEKITEFKPQILKDFYPFDYFTSEKLGQNKYSLAISFIYQNNDSNITDEALNIIHNKFIEQLKNSLPIEVR